MPHFDREAFEFPHGTKEEWLFKQFKEKLEKNGGPAEEEAVEFANELKQMVETGISRTDE